MIVRGARWTILFGTLLLAGVSAPAQEEHDPDKIYEDFNAFCIKHFGAEKEPLVYDKFGKELKILEDGSWRHVSENSAAIAFETNLPAKTTVEYGETPGYGKKTPEPERHFYLHLHHVKDLEVGKTYHYRLVAVDERGNRMTSEDRTFETKTIPNAIYVPGDLGEPPYDLDKPDTTYVLTRDITSATKGFQFKAKNVTLDLNGYTLTYDDGKSAIPYQKYDRGIYRKRDDATFGVKAWSENRSRYTNLRVLNGVIRQGRNMGQGTVHGWGFNPVFIRFCSTEVAGVAITYAGKDVSGLAVDNGEGMKFHHNVVTDSGTHVSNRHQGIDAIVPFGKGNFVHHNLIKRCRQTGIAAGGDGHRIHHNEVYVDSWPTNSSGIIPGNESETYGNRVFATGDSAIGIYVGRIDVKSRKVYDNYVEVYGAPPYEPPRSMEYKKEGQPQQNRVKCARIHLGTFEDLEFANNVLVAKGRSGCSLRGLWIDCRGTSAKNVVIRDNTVKVIAEDDTVEGSAISALGWKQVEEGPRDPFVYRGNTIISNFCNIRFADDYGPTEWAHHFFGNKLVRVGDRPDYRTIICGYWTGKVYDCWLIDCDLEGGASLDSVKFEGTGERREFSVGWTITVKTEPGAKVMITDTTGRAVFSGKADTKGRVATALLEFTRTAQEKILLTPHTIRLEKDGKSRTVNVTANRKQEIVIDLR